MANRMLQEQQLIGDGWKTEWEPCSVQPDMWGQSEKDWSKLVRELNAKAKRDGDNTRFRSIEVED